VGVVTVRPSCTWYLLVGMDSDRDSALHRLADDLLHAAARGDWATVAEAFAPDVVKLDRRQLGLPPISGRDEWVARIRLSFQTIKVREWRTELLETPHERLGLLRVQFWSEEEYSMEYLTVTEIDATGQIVYSVDYDPEDADSAQAELELRARRTGCP